VARLRSEDRDDDVAVVLDRLTALGALAVELDRPKWLTAGVHAFMRIYELGFDAHGVGQPDNPRNVTLWLNILTRAYGIGALAVRLRAWWAVPLLATPRPATRDFETYWLSWLRHAQVQGSRRGISDQQVGVIAQAHNEVRRLASLRPDVAEDDDRVLASLCQFDLLASVAVAAARGKITSASYYPNFASYWTSRTSPAFELLVQDRAVRREIADGLSDEDLAVVLAFILNTAFREAGSFGGGFGGIEAGEIREFLDEHVPPNFDPEVRQWILGGAAHP
jgi:hypothetical protein